MSEFWLSVCEAPCARVLCRSWWVRAGTGVLEPPFRMVPELPDVFPGRWCPAALAGRTAAEDELCAPGLGKRSCLGGQVTAQPATSSGALRLSAYRSRIVKAAASLENSVHCLFILQLKNLLLNVLLMVSHSAHAFLTFPICT